MHGKAIKQKLTVVELHAQIEGQQNLILEELDKQLGRHDVAKFGNIIAIEEGVFASDRSSQRLEELQYPVHSLHSLRVKHVKKPGMIELRPSQNLQNESKSLRILQ